MKLWGIFRFELGYQLRRAWPWLYFGVLLLVAFLMARDSGLADAMYEDFYVNSAFAIAKTTVVAGLLWLLMAAPVAGEAAARDVATRMYPLVYTAPISKGEYLGGKFLAALVLNAWLLLAVQAGIMLGVYSPGVAPQVIGPFRIAAFLSNYAVIALPNAFAATAIQFALASRSGRAMASYLGSLFLIFMSFFVASLLLFRRSLGTLLDPIGMRFVIEDMAHEWTTIERKVRLIGLEGVLLTNRLVWFGFALAVLAVTYLSFRFAHRAETGWWKRRSGARQAAIATADAIAVEANATIAVPQVSPSFGFAIEARKTLAIAWTSFRSIAKSWAGLAMLIGIPLLTVPVVIDQMAAIAVPLVPTTARVLAELTGSLSNEMSRWVIIPLLVVFFAGELVWREREAGVAEIVDAMPGSDWVPLLGKLLGIALMLVAFTVMQMAAGMLAQTIMGHHDYEIGLYLKVLFGLQLPDYLLVAVLALVVHVLVNQKYVGHLVAVLAYAFIVLLAGMLGIEHNLLVYGAGPGWSYTQMRGFGASLAPWGWFKLYWVSWALLLAVVARLLWVRGKESGARVRVHLMRQRTAGATARTAGVATVLIASLGGYIFYNTNVLNAYNSSSHIDERRAEYERRYRRFENIPQPRIAGTTLNVELYPKRRVVEIRGSYLLVNRSARSIDSIHVVTATDGVKTGAITFDRAAALAVDDTRHGYRIYALEKSLEPGDSLGLDFEVHVAPRGFGNRGVDPSIAPRGSYFTNAAWFPAVGYQRMRELLSASDRREHGLEPRPLVASLYDEEGLEPTTRGGGIAFEAVMGTDSNQVAIAPGALRRTWIEGGRRYFQYSTTAPIGDEWTFFSADYAVREANWNGVAIRIYHDPAHTAHLDRMLRGVLASMDYYTKQFGPYSYDFLNLVEHPGAPGTGMHADAGMIYYGQGIPFWIPKSEDSRLDFPYAVLGHEMGHEWGLPYAVVEGAPLLSEGLAWYSAIQLVKATRGSEQLHQLLTFMRQPYPHRPIRRGEPLLRAMDPYLSYRRGPFAMYALSEYVGANRVNGALRHLIETHDAPGASLATTLDLYRELQSVTPDSLRYLLHDLFEVNAYWELKTERATSVEKSPGNWQVTLDVRARKMVYDSAGVESELPMDEWVPIGVFGAVADDADELSAPLYQRMYRIGSGLQTITVTVSRKPVLAGIDPYHVLDWVEEGDDDNIEVVKGSE